MASDIDRRLKDMAYGSGETECIALGIYRGFQYAVYNIRGSHPCGYVNISGHENELISSRDSSYDWDRFSWLDCHGGVTYAETNLSTFTGGYWIGWDYAHLGDYSHGIDNFGICHYTGEIVLECKHVINQICKRLEVEYGK